MRSSRLARHTPRWIGLGLLAALAACTAAAVLPQPAAAQQPFLAHDAFYRGETARRVFFDGYAFSGEVAYRPSSGALQDEGAPSVDPLGFSFRFDYQLAQQLDLGAVVDASGGRTGRTLSVSWIVLKYYEFAEETDYAFRLAVDPASDGLVGFPQMDAAFLFTTPLRPWVSNDLALGVRRVRMGYDRWVRTRHEADGAMNAGDPPANFDVVRTRVMGWELHAMFSYDLRFDPAGSNVSLTLLAEGGEYDLFEASASEASPAPNADEAPAAPPLTTTYQSGVVWLRSGVEYNRPSFQVNPFVGLPLQQWTSEDGDALRTRLSAGLSLMIR